MDCKPSPDFEGAQCFLCKGVQTDAKPEFTMYVFQHIERGQFPQWERCVRFKDNVIEMLDIESDNQISLL